MASSLPLKMEAPLLEDRLRTRRDEFDQIPVIDISALRDGRDAHRVAKEMRWALSNVGFMYIKGHGVPESRIAAAFDATQRFFAEPDPVKDAVHIRKSGDAMRGYTAIFEENTNPGVTLDYKECYDAGITYPNLSGPFQGENQWPQTTGFRDAIETYQKAMVTTARIVLSGIAMSLDLPGDYFAEKMKHPLVIQRLLHYPSQSGQIDERIIGIGAHTDYGLMTILAQDDVGGLQILNRAGNWVEVPPIPGTFTLNISDLVQRLTNDVYLANLHRVVNLSGRERYSLPCFIDCDFDAVIAPLESCITEDRPRAYDPVQCGHHKLSRYTASFQHLEKA